MAIASNFILSCPIWHAASLPFLSALSNCGTSCRPKSLMLPREKFSNSVLMVFGPPCLFPNPPRTSNIFFLYNYYFSHCKKALSWLFGAQVPFCRPLQFLFLYLSCVKDQPYRWKHLYQLSLKMIVDTWRTQFVPRVHHRDWKSTWPWYLKLWWARKSFTLFSVFISVKHHS